MLLGKSAGWLALFAAAGWRSVVPSPRWFPARPCRHLPGPPQDPAGRRRGRRQRRVSISAAALEPLSASICPPMRNSGADHRATAASGATAREVTASAPPALSTTSSARPRTTRQLVNSSMSSTSRRNSTRRSSGSTRMIRQSGRATANGMPGRPAPDPMSTTVNPGDNSSATTPELSTCRLHNRLVSLGPITPRSTPSPARMST